MTPELVVVITGAGRGIGRGLAQHFCQAGAAVVMNDSGVALDGSPGDPELIFREAATLREAGGKVIASSASVALPTTAPALLDEALRTFGRVDVWINGAAIMRGRMLFNMSDEDWQSVREIGLDGTFYGMRTALKHMRETKTGRVINLISAAGLVGNLGVASYAAAKAGVVGLTRVGALEMQRYGVAVNAVVPFAHTRMTDVIKGGTPLVDAYLAGANAARVDHLYPLFDYLVHKAAPTVSGQIFAGRGQDMFLFSQARPVHRLTSAQWTADSLAQEIGDQWQSAFVPLETELDLFAAYPAV